MSDIDHFWASANFSSPSWPLPPSELQMLAEELGLDDEEPRQYLRDEIERRRVASAGDSPDVTPVAHQHEI